jgi:hypothetical protein
MTDDEIMRQLSQAVRDDVLAAEEMVAVGQEQHPEWDWPFMATVLWIQRGQMQEQPELPRQPAWRRWWRRPPVGADGETRPTRAAAKNEEQTPSGCAHARLPRPCISPDCVLSP